MPRSNQEKVYGEEVLGKHVVVQFMVDGTAGTKPFLGKVRSFKITLQDDGSREREHQVIFDDGEEVAFDLENEEAEKRLTWVINGSPASAPSTTARKPPAKKKPPPAKAKKRRATPAAASTTALTTVSTAASAAASIVSPARKKSCTASVLEAYFSVTPEPTTKRAKSRVQGKAKKDDDETSSEEDDDDEDQVDTRPASEHQVDTRPASADGISRFNLDQRFDDMDHWLRTVPHGVRGEPKIADDRNAKSVMKIVRKLASGTGVGYRNWPDEVVFYEGRLVDLSFDFWKMLGEAKDYENEHGRDLGNGWLLRHPLVKLRLYKEYVLANE